MNAPGPTPVKRQMPRNAVRAIAYSGHFCGVMTAFLIYFAWRNGFHSGLIALNVATALFLFIGSFWMLHRLRSVP